jgi:hypothetical protein
MKTNVKINIPSLEKPIKLIGYIGTLLNKLSNDALLINSFNEKTSEVLIKTTICDNLILVEELENTMEHIVEAYVVQGDLIQEDCENFYLFLEKFINDFIDPIDHPGRLRHFLCSLFTVKYKTYDGSSNIQVKYGKETNSWMIKIPKECLTSEIKEMQNKYIELSHQFDCGWTNII